MTCDPPKHKYKRLYIKYRSCCTIKLVNYPKRGHHVHVCHHDVCHCYYDVLLYVDIIC